MVLCVYTSVWHMENQHLLHSKTGGTARKSSSIRSKYENLMDPEDKFSVSPWWVIMYPFGD